MIEAEVINLDKQKGKLPPICRQVEISTGCLIREVTFEHSHRLSSVSELVEQFGIATILYAEITDPDFAASNTPIVRTDLHQRKHRRSKGIFMN